MNFIYFQKPQTSGGGITEVAINYTDLVNLVSTNSLDLSAKYRLTTTIEYILDYDSSAKVYSYTIELILTPETTNRLSPIALDTNSPNDIVIYNLNNIGNSVNGGNISYRKNQDGNEANFDFVNYEIELYPDPSTQTGYTNVPNVNPPITKKIFLVGSKNNKLFFKNGKVSLLTLDQFNPSTTVQIIDIESYLYSEIEACSGNINSLTIQDTKIWSCGVDIINSNFEICYLQNCLLNLNKTTLVNNNNTNVNLISNNSTIENYAGDNVDLQFVNSLVQDCSHASNPQVTRWNCQNSKVTNILNLYGIVEFDGVNEMSMPGINADTFVSYFIQAKFNRNSFTFKSLMPKTLGNQYIFAIPTYTASPNKIAITRSLIYSLDNLASAGSVYQIGTNTPSLNNFAVNVAETAIISSGINKFGTNTGAAVVAYLTNQNNLYVQCITQVTDSNNQLVCEFEIQIN